MPIKQGGWQDVKFEQAMEIAGYGKFSMYIILLSGLSICAAFLSSLDVSFLLPAAECDLQLTSQDKGLLSSAYFIGIISASHLSGFLADTLGRRYVLIRGLSLNVLTYICGTFAPNFWTLFVFKVLSGITTCPCMIATIPFLGEFVPTKRRTQALLTTSSLSTLGLLYSSLVGWATLQSKWEIDLWLVIFKPWRLFFLLCSLPSLLCAVLFYFTPESPKFLLTRGKKGDTMKVLQRVHSVNSGKVPQSYPVHSVTVDADETLPPVREKGAAGAFKHIFDQTVPLFEPSYLRNLVLCIILYFTTFFSVNSVFLWLPEVSNRIAQHRLEHDGEHYLCDMVLKVSAGNETAAETAECESTVNSAVFIPNLVIAVVQPTVMLVFSLAVPHVNRKLIIMVVMVAAGSMSLLVTRIPNPAVIIVLFGGTPILVGISFNVLTSILIELFPTYIRAMAVSLAMICGRMGSIVGSHLFSQLIDSRCTLLFHLIAALLFCCALLPFCLNLKSRKTENVKEDFPPRSETI